MTNAPNITSSLSRTTPVLLAALALGACRSKPAEPPPSAITDVVAAAPAASADDPTTSRDVATPLVLRLEPSGPIDVAGAVDVVLRVQIPAPLGYVVELGVSPPPGVTVTASELASIGPAESGALTRKVSLRLDAPLSLERPLVVVARGQSTGGAVGLRAEQQLPSKPELRVAPQPGPVPPGGRPPGPASLR